MHMQYTLLMHLNVLKCFAYISLTLVKTGTDLVKMCYYCLAGEKNVEIYELF